MLLPHSPIFGYVLWGDRYVLYVYTFLYYYFQMFLFIENV